MTPIDEIKRIESGATRVTPDQAAELAGTCLRWIQEAESLIERYKPTLSDLIGDPVVVEPATKRGNLARNVAIQHHVLGDDIITNDGQSTTVREFMESIENEVGYYQRECLRLQAENDELKGRLRSAELQYENEASIRKEKST
jgi:hypothetical protein